MRNVLRSCMVLGLFAAVATTTVTSALAATAKAKVQFIITTEGVTYINLTANGPNGQLRGKGTMKLGKAATYPMVVTSGSFATAASSGGGGSGGGSSGGGSGGSSVSGTVTLNGYVTRQRVRVPFVLVGETESGDSTLTCTVTTTTAGTTTITDVDTDWTGRVTLGF